MPLFEYTCKECSHRFEVIVMGGKKPSCPSCGSRRLEKMLSTFAVSTGSAKGPARGGPPPCGNCSDPRGPGSCPMN